MTYALLTENMDADGVASFNRALEQSPEEYQQEREQAAREQERADQTAVFAMMGGRAG